MAHVPATWSAGGLGLDALKPQRWCPRSLAGRDRGRKAGGSAMANSLERGTVSPASRRQTGLNARQNTQKSARIPLKIRENKPICDEMALFKPDILHPVVPLQPGILPPPAQLSPFVGFQDHNLQDFCRPATLRFATFLENL